MKTIIAWVKSLFTKKKFTQWVILRHKNQIDLYKNGKMVASKPMKATIIFFKSTSK